MTTRPKPDATFVAGQSMRMYELIQQRAWLPPEDMDYVAETTSKMKDPRFKACVAELVGWGTDERAELETFVAIAIEVMKKTTVTRLREAAQTVHLRHLVRDL